MSRVVRRIILVVGALSLFLLTSCGAEFNVYYTASLNGNLLGCDCWGYPEAGLDKRALYLNDLPPAPGSLLLDAGNFLEVGRDPVLADYILKTYASLHYDAVAVGTHELAEGLDTLQIRAVNSDNHVQPRFLSHNILIRADSSDPWKALSIEPLIHETGTETRSTRVAVISLADPEWFAPYLSAYDGRLDVADPLDTLLRGAQTSRAAGATSIVLLAHGSAEWARRLVSEYQSTAKSNSADQPGLLAVILAGEEALIEEKLQGNIPLLSPGDEGNRLGDLSLKLRRRGPPRWKNRFILFHYLEPGDPEVTALGVEYAAYLDLKRR